MVAESVWRRWRQKVHDILEVGGAAYPASYFVNAFIVTLILFNAVIFAAETVDGLAERYGAAFEAFNNFTVAVFTVEYVLRIWSAVDIPLSSRLPPWKARLRFAARPLMIIDLMAILPWYLGDLIPINLVFLRVLRLFRLPHRSANSSGASSWLSASACSPFPSPFLPPVSARNLPSANS